jgi:hypothetical protein
MLQSSSSRRASTCWLKLWPIGAKEGLGGGLCSQLGACCSPGWACSHARWANAFCICSTSAACCFARIFTSLTRPPSRRAAHSEHAQGVTYSCCTFVQGMSTYVQELLLQTIRTTSADTASYIQVLLQPCTHKNYSYNRIRKSMSARTRHCTQPLSHLTLNPLSYEPSICIGQKNPRGGHRFFNIIQ